ncbi:hypothetical protein ACOQFV_16610 [Nocardiopsis changdeensis]|uniref:Uncharacterized protein n=1 Tax=Nocardiopsis changdeensis TaxID=2831969 RepID=A0ABX8BHX9_9ACTN|nr:MULTISPECIES: hypothetical protein [Nocardiopsis]QUX21842.1 hypothetical protein KGD84_26235 [Nocardiopsis changdeensis]QYX37777.1 hypothetical protein K1J57_03620 [Nocardiopsis sp. MT53]
MQKPIPLPAADAAERLADDMRNERVYVFCPNRFWSSVLVGCDGGTLYLPTALGVVFVEETNTEPMWEVVDSLPRPIEAGESVLTWPRTPEGHRELLSAGIDNTPPPQEAGSLPLLLIPEEGRSPRMPKLLTDAISVYEPVSAARIRARARHVT